MVEFKSYRDHKAAGHPVIYESKTTIFGDTTYECAFCGITTDTHSIMKTHIKRHRKEGSY